jgi:hypothetical protein
VQAFNLSFGELTQVRISFAGEATQSFFVVAPESYTLTNQVSLTVGISGGPIVATPGSILHTLSGTLPTGQLYQTLNTPINFTGSYADADHLALFVGTGTIDLVAHAFEDVQTRTSVSGNGTGGSSSSASLGSIFVEYTYTPIPEPAAFAAIFGLVAFGLVVRRRNSLANPPERP